jgi:hypothetical protein
VYALVADCIHRQAREDRRGYRQRMAEEKQAAAYIRRHRHRHPGYTAEDWAKVRGWNLAVATRALAMVEVENALSSEAAAGS